MLRHRVVVVEADELHQGVGLEAAGQPRRNAPDAEVCGVERRRLEMPTFELSSDSRWNGHSTNALECTQRIEGRNDGVASKLAAVRAAQLVARVDSRDSLDRSDRPVLDPGRHTFPI